MGLSVSYLGSSHDATTAQTRSFGPFTASSDGLFVIVVVGKAQGNPGFDALTIQGHNANPPHQHQNTNTITSYIASAEVTAGSVTVAVDYAGGIFDNPGNSDQWCYAYLLTHYASATPDDSNKNIANDTHVDLGSIDISADGVAIYGGAVEVSGGVSWSGATEKADGASADSYEVATAQFLSVGGTTSHTETMTWSGVHTGVLAGASWHGDGSSAVDYTLACATGAFTLTGKAAALVNSPIVHALVGAFTLTGKSAALVYGRKIMAAVGAFVLTGKAAAFPRAHKVLANVHHFTLVGVRAILLAPFTRTRPAVKAKVLNGKATSLSRLRSVLSRLTRA